MSPYTGNEQLIVEMCLFNPFETVNTLHYYVIEDISVHATDNC